MRAGTIKPTNRQLFTVGLALLAVLALGALRAPRALADPVISNIAPTNESGDLYRDQTPLNGASNPPSPLRPWFNVSYGTSESPVAWQKIYVPVDDDNPVRIAIEKGGGWCFDPTAWTTEWNFAKETGPDQSYPDVAYSIRPLSADETTTGAPSTPPVSTDSLYSPGYDTTCRDLSLTIPAGSGVASDIPGHQNYRVFLFEADLTLDYVCISGDDAAGNPIIVYGQAACAATGGTWKEFRLCADTCVEGGSPVLIGFSRTVDSLSGSYAAFPFGISQIPLEAEYGINPGGDASGPSHPVQGDPSQSIDWTYHFYFAPECDEYSTQSTLTFFDADYGSTNFLPQYLNADLYSSLRTGTTYNLADSWPGSALGGNNEAVNLDFGTSPIRRYKLSVNQFFFHNIIQVYVPLDQIDADSSVVTCVKAASCNLAPQDFEPGQQQTLTASVVLYNYSAHPITFSRPNSNNGYNFNVTWAPGVSVVPASVANSPPNPTVPNDGQPHTINITMQAEVDYTGSVTLDLFADDSSLNVPGLPCTLDVTPSTRPYFQVWDAGTGAGGAFANVDGSCTTNLPTYVSPTTALDAGQPNSAAQYYGGIRAFGDPADARGSMTDFGAVAMGQIPLSTDSNGNEVIGFYTPNDMYFANRNVPGLNTTSVGGYLNSNSVNHCTQDFYTTTREESNPAPVGAGNWDTQPSDQYTLSGNTLDGGNVGNKQITIYAPGDVTITGNITYPATYDPNVDPSSPNSTPYFVLIAKGNIYVSPNVTQLDGLYVAQPDGGGNNGIFATCTPGDHCPKQLVVNGAVIAQHAELLRAHGTLGPLKNDPNNISTNPAEIVDFPPSLIIGTPQFAPEPNRPQSLFSLPPVF